MNSTQISIKGMHCPSCELLIEKNLKKISGISRVEISHKTGKAKIFFESAEPDRTAIVEAIKSAGYHIGETSRSGWLSENAKDYQHLGFAILLALAGWWLIGWLGLNNLNIGIADNPKGLYISLLIGLVAGFSTCMALVGGLTLGLAAKYAEKHQEAGAGAKFRPHLFFNLGRVLGFALLGGLLGVLGSIFQFSGLTMAFLTLLVALVMLLLGVQLTEISPRITAWKITLPKKISRIVGLSQEQEGYSHRGALLLGALSFFLPCGFTQAMQLYAVSTGSFYLGALTMALFALGTAPGLLSIGGITSVIKANKSRFFFKFAGVVVIFLALFNTANALTLARINLNLGSEKINKDRSNNDVAGVVIEDGFQVIRMTEDYSGYLPNRIIIQEGIPVRWIITAKAPYSCASALVVPRLKINKTLVAGENIIEFPAQPTGQIPFSCSMGMYTGVFIVADNSGALPPGSEQITGSTAVSGGTCNHGSGGGCGCGKPTAQIY